MVQYSQKFLLQNKKAEQLQRKLALKISKKIRDKFLKKICQENTTL
jgi:hypothetical protein